VPNILNNTGGINMTTFNFNSKRFRKLSERVFLDSYSGQYVQGVYVYLGYTLKDIPYFDLDQLPQVIKHIRLYEPTKNNNFKLIKGKGSVVSRKLAA
jgi:hypothetical protein